MLRSWGSVCFDGHLVSPQEQNTQSSPSFGTNTAEQLRHWKRMREKRVGMTSTLLKWQCGHVTTESVFTTAVCAEDTASEWTPQMKNL